MKQIVVRLQGGLGNQLFCYAAARRLSIKNSADLLLDTVTGFRRDFRYKRNYALDPFNIAGRKATRNERLDPLYTLRKRVHLLMDRTRPFESKRYYREEFLDFDPRILDIKPRGKIYLDGYWQSECYFKDVSSAIRNDLVITPPTDPINKELSRKIADHNSVCIHVRFFNGPTSDFTKQRLYYSHASKLMDQLSPDCHYFVFSDRPDATDLIGLTNSRTTLVSHNQDPTMHHADMWLMQQCRGFIITNSTFSWWAAWLRHKPSNPVVYPAQNIAGASAWGFSGQMPDEWTPIQVPDTII